MKRIMCALILAASCGAAAAADPAAVLTPEGLGIIKIGMTGKVLQGVLREKLIFEYDPLGGNACGTASSKSNEAIGISFTLNGGYLERISINYNDKGVRSPIRTEAGIGLGSTEDEVRQAYGNRVSVQPHPNDPSWHYLIVDDASHTRAIIFETDGKKVVHMRAGIYPVIVQPDGCL